MPTLSLHWKPSTAIFLSIILFLACIIATIWHPQWWLWATGIVMANHLTLTIAGLLPRSTLLGPNWNRLPDAAAQQREVTITIDDGPDPQVTPQVLEILDRYQARVTFFCIGVLAEQHPEICREIVRRGHSIENHSQHHNTFFSLFGPARIYHEILKAQQTLEKITGRKPQYFRPTAGLRNPFLDPVLNHLGLHLVSWTRRGFDTRQSNPDIVFAKITRDLKAGDILLLHDGNSAKDADGQPIILNVLPRLLERLAQERLHSVPLHSRLP